MVGERAQKDFIAAFGDDPGVLPDGRIMKSDGTDWSPILRSFSDVGWVPRWTDDDRVVEAAHVLDPVRAGGVFRIRPVPGVQINFFAGDEVLFDIDLRELIREEAVAAVYDVMRLLGSASGKHVVLSTEGVWDEIVVSFDPVSRHFSWRIDEALGAELPRRQ